MGGSSLGRAVTGIATGGLSEIGRAAFNNDTARRAILAGSTGGLSEFLQKNPYGLPVGNPLPGIFHSDNEGERPIAGPFSLDPYQLSADQSAINKLGTQQKSDLNTLAQSQYEQNLKQIPDLVSKQIELENPDIMESLNATHQLNSTAYPTELARRQAELTQSLVVPATQQLQQQQLAALNTGQGFESGALQRGLSLEDQINNANISKTIGQVFAPQPPTGKQNFGTTAQGIGAIATPFAKAGKA